ncbi:MAG: hypothetical protein HY519_02640 [Candidatus Aenigmarchaeota archaeon]|nr:hypothetical protein [Candidatus Aenigmarchaeota archaeon]
MNASVHALLAALLVAVLFFSSASQLLSLTGMQVAPPEDSDPLADITQQEAQLAELDARLARAEQDCAAPASGQQCHLGKAATSLFYFNFQQALAFLQPCLPAAQAAANKPAASKLPDLAISDLAVKRMDRNNVQVGFVVGNRGDRETGKEFGLAVELDGKAVIDTSFTGSLAPGSRYELPGFVVTAPGPGKIRVILDPENVIEESDESNNQAETGVLDAVSITGKAPADPERDGGDTCLPTWKDDGCGQGCRPGQMAQIEIDCIDGKPTGGNRCVDSAQCRALAQPCKQAGSRCSSSADCCSGACARSSSGPELVCQKAADEAAVRARIAEVSGGNEQQFISDIVAKLRKIDAKDCQLVPERKRQVEEARKVVEIAKQRKTCLLDQQAMVNAGECEGDALACLKIARNCLALEGQLAEGMEKLAAIRKGIEQQEQELTEEIKEVERNLGKESECEKLCKTGLQCNKGTEFVFRVFVSKTCAHESVCMEILSKEQTDQTILSDFTPIVGEICRQ